MADDAPHGWVEGIANKFEVDRYAELMYPETFAKALPAFMLNPVFSLGHDISGAYPSGLPLGSIIKAWVEADGFHIRAAFASNPIAQMVRGLYQEGHMRGFSVQFIPKAGGVRDPTPEEMTKYPGVRIVITEIDLIEIAAAVVPVNAGSLATAVKALSPITGPAEIKAMKSFFEAAQKTLEAATMQKQLTEAQKSIIGEAVKTYGEAVTIMATVAQAIEALQKQETSDHASHAGKLAESVDSLKASFSAMGECFAKMKSAFEEGGSDEEITSADAEVIKEGLLALTVK